MSKRHDLPGIDAGKLLTDDGEIDPQAVRAIDDSAVGTNLTASTCHRLRYLVGASDAADSATEAWNALGVSHSAARRHIRGECDHLGRTPTHPPLHFQQQGQTWVIDE